MERLGEAWRGRQVAEVYRMLNLGDQDGEKQRCWRTETGRRDAGRWQGEKTHAEKEKKGEKMREMKS